MIKDDYGIPICRFSPEANGQMGAPMGANGGAQLIRMSLITSRPPTPYRRGRRQWANNQPMEAVDEKIRNGY